MTDQQYTLPLTKVTGVVVVAHQATRTYAGTAAQLEEAYKKAQVHNLLFGWWSIPSLIWNPIALVRNINRIKSLRALAAQPHADQ